MFRHYKDIERPSASVDTPHITRRVYQCDLCSEGEGWDSESEVFIHRTVNHVEELIDTIKKADTEPVCLICIKKFDSPSSLQKHINQEHLLSSEDARRVEREIFVCDICSQVFFNKEMLSVHLAQNHKFKDKRDRMECPKCKKCFRVDGLWTHFQFHQMQSVSSCPICLDKCQDRQALQEHLNTHQKYYCCNTCLYHTAKRASFYDHIAIHDNMATSRQTISDHIVKKYFVGTDCDHHWRRRQKLNVFRGLILSRQVKICIICREICNKDNMKQHILKHLKKSPSDGNLNKHMCVCGEIFFNKVLLKQHVFKAEGNHRALDENEIRQQEQNKGSNTELLKFTDVNDQMYHIEVQGETILPDKENSNAPFVEITVPGGDVILPEEEIVNIENSDNEPMNELPEDLSNDEEQNVTQIISVDSVDEELQNEEILPEVKRSVANSKGKKLQGKKVSLIKKGVFSPVRGQRTTVATKTGRVRKGNSLPVIEVE